MSPKSNVFCQLNWKIRKSDGVVYAEPHGLRWSYYIKSSEENKNIFELAYVENNGSFQEYGKLFEDVNSAQKIAQQHYEDILVQHIIKAIS